MDISWQIIALAAAITYLAEVCGPLVGGGGIFVQTALVALGIPPATVIANDVASGIGTKLTSIYVFHKKPKLVQWRVAMWIVPGALLGGFAGGTLLTRIPAESMKTIIGCAALMSVAYTLFGKRDLGVAERVLPRWWKARAILFGGVSGTWTGISGAGTNMITSLMMVVTFGMTHVQAMGTRPVIALVSASAAAVMFVHHGLVHPYLVIAMFVASAAAGFTSSRIVLWLGNARLKWIVTIVVTTLAVWLLVS